MCLSSHPTLPILLSHCKLSDGDSEVSGTCPVFATCVYDWDTAASQFLHGDSQPFPQYWLNFLGHVQARCLHKKEQKWLDLVLWAFLLLYLIFKGEGSRGAKALVAANGYQ